MLYPRSKSNAAQQRQAALQAIAEKRSLQQKNIASKSYKQLEDSDASTPGDELEDSSASENTPPPQIAARKPSLGRLKRNVAMDSKPKSSVDDLLGNMQSMSISKPNTSRDIPFRDVGNTARDMRQQLVEASAVELPSSDDEKCTNSEKDGGLQDSSDTDGDTSSAASTPDSARPVERPGFSSNFFGEQESGGMPTLKILDPTKPHEGAFVLGEKQEYVLPATLHQKLYKHQVEGVSWLWSLYRQRRGGILGDDMGMGKTMQCSAFIAGLINSKLAKRVLVIAPKTLLAHWEKELKVCGLGSKTRDFSGTSQSEREAALRTTTGAAGGVLLTTYGMVLHNADKLSAPASMFSGFRRPSTEEDNEDFKWDMVFLDEGHKVKNPKMQLVQQLRLIPVGAMIIITGTPIQNNLMELHALYDLCCEGLLGDAKSFKSVYERRITAGQDRDATPRDKAVGAAIANELRDKIAPFFLRREKGSLKEKDSAGEAGNNNTSNISNNTGSGSSPTSSADGSGSGGNACGSQGAASSSAVSAVAAGPPKPQALGHKNDLVVWLQLQPLQRKVYKAFLHSDAVKEALNKSNSPLAAITVLKKICDHPALLSEASAEAIIAGGKRWARQGHHTARRRDSYDDYSDSCSDSDKTSDDEDDSGSNPDADAVDDIIPNLGSDVRSQLVSEMRHKEAQASCKTVFVLALLDALAQAGHRTLVFSQSIVMLDILQAAVAARGVAYCRIDGKVSSAEDRQAEVRRFQSPGSDIPLFLLSSKVGGLGLTLTAADRVVIVDPSWNPAQDNQAVDRAYRIGQTRDVVVYRLITCGTVEEKIYRKQVFKQGLSKTGTEEGVQFRYFSQQQLRDLFTVTDAGLDSSDTQRDLHARHAAQRVTNPVLEDHLQFLGCIQGFAGISDHDLLFTSKAGDGSNLSSDERKALVQQLEGEAQREAIMRGGGGDTRRANFLSGVGGGGGGSSKGDHELSGLLSRGLVPDDVKQRPQQLAVDAQLRTVSELTKKLNSMTATLSNKAILPSLPDGGARLLKQRDALIIDLDKARHQLSVLQAQAQAVSAGGSPSTAPAQGPAAAAAPTSSIQEDLLDGLSQQMAKLKTPSHVRGKSSSATPGAAGGSLFMKDQAVVATPDIETISLYSDSSPAVSASYGTPPTAVANSHGKLSKPMDASTGNTSAPGSVGATTPGTEASPSSNTIDSTDGGFTFAQPHVMQGHSGPRHRTGAAGAATTSPSYSNTTGHTPPGPSGAANNVHAVSNIFRAAESPSNSYMSGSTVNTADGPGTSGANSGLRRGLNLNYGTAKQRSTPSEVTSGVPQARTTAVHVTPTSSTGNTRVGNAHAPGNAVKATPTSTGVTATPTTSLFSGAAPGHAGVHTGGRSVGTAVTGSAARAAALTPASPDSFFSAASKGPADDHDSGDSDSDDCDDMDLGTPEVTSTANKPVFVPERHVPQQQQVVPTGPFSHAVGWNNSASVGHPAFQFSHPGHPGHSHGQQHQYVGAPAGHSHGSRSLHGGGMTHPQPAALAGHKQAPPPQHGSDVSRQQHRSAGQRSQPSPHSFIDLTDD